MAHGVVRTDLMHGTDVGAELVSFRYFDSNDNPEVIDNGNVIKLDGFVDGKREIRIGIAAPANAAIAEVALVACPEVMYEVNKSALDDFYLEAGKNGRAYRLCPHDIFSVTEDAVDIANGVDIEVGDYCLLQGTNKFLLTDTEAVNTNTTVGKIIAIEETAKYKYFVIEVE